MPCEPALECVGVKSWAAIIAIVVPAGAFAGADSDGFTILYENGPWTVFRYAGTNAGDPPSYCSARSAEGTGFLELLATREVGCLSAEDTGWTFSEHTGEVGFFIGESGIYVDNGRYYSDGLQICADAASTDELIDLLWSADGDAIDAFDESHAKIGSFPGGDREEALKVWRECRDSE
jgi:hypothetical protein